MPRHERLFRFTDLGLAVTGRAEIRSFQHGRTRFLASRCGRSRSGAAALRPGTALDTADFYGEAGGYSSYYGQSRYLCYYLQEKDLLVRFYREFVANAKDDPTGFKTLKKVLGEPDMAAFQKKWEEYVGTLKFP